MKKLLIISLLCLILTPHFIHARPTTEADVELPLRRIALLSSGVGYFEHSGTLNSPAQINLPFDAWAMNDVLMSLVINDPASDSPAVRYAAQDSLWRALRSLRIDLSGFPGVAEILNSQRGAEVEVSAPSPIQGRIIGVEQRAVSVPFHGPQHFPMHPSFEAWLSLFTPQGIRAIAVRDIASFRFIDERLNADLNRALDLLLTYRDTEVRDLMISLNGNGTRPVSISYVIPTPVWKVSYRLDLNGPEPVLQGWAIVDNDSDTDWTNVELSLISGRPVSFIQNLFPPHRLSRPFVPLSIAGFAESVTHETAWGRTERILFHAEESAADMIVMESAQMLRAAPMASPAPGAIAQRQVAPGISAGVLETAAARAAGDHFEFTLRNPVSLGRRQSAMFPLVESTIQAEKTLVFPGARALGGVTINPWISVELTNTTGMSLPAGPITVFDGGIYAGDALIEFFPENERRLISFAQDLSVSGSASSSGNRFLTGASIANGLMTITRRQSHEMVYTIRNASDETKRIVIEHTITPGSELVYPREADERTAVLYRFNRSLNPRETHTFRVREETPLFERVTLMQLRPEAILSFATNQEIPANVRAALARAVELRRVADTASQTLRDLETQRTRLFAEQDRIRRNLEAAGNQSPQGQEYLRRLVSLDGDIDRVNAQINEVTIEQRRAQREFEDYLSTLTI